MIGAELARGPGRVKLARSLFAHHNAPVRERLHALGNALGRQPHLMAVRDGVVGSLPLILLGSLFLLLAQPPWPAISRFLPAAPTLLAGYAACAGLVAIYACVATALSLARRREADGVAGATTALAVLLVAQHPFNKMLPMSALGAAGLFPAFAAAIFSVEVLHFFARRKWGIKLSGGAPDVVVRSFAALLPTVSCVVLVWFVVHVLDIDLAAGIANLVRPLVHGGDSLAAVMVVVLIDSALWLVGVHGISVLAAVRPLWLAALAENMAAASSGLPPPHVFTQEFFIWFVWQGGSGTTLAFALLLLFARSKQLRLVGRAGIVPAIFNINEPLLFGAPVVMNGKLAPPFVAAPLVLVVLSWCAMRFGVVRPPYIEVVWTLPAPVGAYLASGGDAKAVVLQVVNLALALLMWWPFVRRYDRSLLAAEATA
ncbi:MAG TPA: PTS transporter subunit EIIC [Myxococcales bacterium]|nr:PTS transporter subunit EIIC [Myxococcales bacterium]